MLSIRLAKFQEYSNKFRLSDLFLFSTSAKNPDLPREMDEGLVKSQNFHLWKTSQPRRHPLPRKRMIRLAVAFSKTWAV